MHYLDAMKSSRKSRLSISLLQPLRTYHSLRSYEERERERLEKRGLEAIRRGEVAVITLSAQEEFLESYRISLGMFNIGLPSRKSIFHLFADRIRRLECLSRSLSLSPEGAKREQGIEGGEEREETPLITWYIMTTAENDLTLRKFFNERNFFDLSEEQVVFFSQGSLPSLSVSGKIILETSSRVSLSSLGSGGLMDGLLHDRVLEDMKKKKREGGNGGTKYVHICTVENVLCRVADPAFLGFHIERGAVA